MEKGSSFLEDKDKKAGLIAAKPNAAGSSSKRDGRTFVIQGGEGIEVRDNRLKLALRKKEEEL